MATTTTKSAGAAGLAAYAEKIGLGRPEPELEFAKVLLGRKWRFDLSWPGLLWALEIEGGTRQQGRHNRHAGYEKDCEKYNAAALLGWRVLRVTTEMVTDGRAFALLDGLKEYLNEEAG